MTPIVIDGREHHCDLHARLVAEVENAARERPGTAIPLKLTITTDDEHVRVDDHRDLCDEATDHDEERSEALRATIAGLWPDDTAAMIRECVEETSPDHFTTLPQWLTVRSTTSSDVSRPFVVVTIDGRNQDGVTVALKVDALPAVLAVPLVMLVVEELCRANLSATVILETMALCAEAEHLAA